MIGVFVVLLLTISMVQAEPIRPQSRPGTESIESARVGSVIAKDDLEPPQGKLPDPQLSGTSKPPQPVFSNSLTKPTTPLQSTGDREDHDGPLLAAAFLVLAGLVSFAVLGMLFSTKHTSRGRRRRIV